MLRADLTIADNRQFRGGWGKVLFSGPKGCYFWQKNVDFFEKKQISPGNPRKISVFPKNQEN